MDWSWKQAVPQVKRHVHEPCFRQLEEASWAHMAAIAYNIVPNGLEPKSGQSSEDQLFDQYL